MVSRVAVFATDVRVVIVTLSWMSVAIVAVTKQRVLAATADRDADALNAVASAHMDATNAQSIVSARFLRLFLNPMVAQAQWLICQSDAEGTSH